MKFILLIVFWPWSLVYFLCNPTNQATLVRTGSAVVYFVMILLGVAFLLSVIGSAQWPQDVNQAPPEVTRLKKENMS